MPNHQFAPFGIAFYAAVRGAGFSPMGALAVAGAVLAGAYSLPGASIIHLALLAAALIVCQSLATAFKVGRKEGSPIGAAVLAAIAVAIPALMLIGRNNTVELIFWTAVTGVLALIFTLGILDCTSGRVLRSPDNTVPALLLVAAALCGLSGVTVAGIFQPLHIAAALLIMACAYAGGAPMGSVAAGILGISLLFTAFGTRAQGVAPSISAEEQRGMAFVVAGVLGGWFRELRKVAVSLAFVIGLVTYVALTAERSSEIISVAVNGGTALLLLWLTPTGWLARIPAAVVTPKSPQPGTAPETAGALHMVDRLRGMARVLKEVNRTMDQVAVVDSPAPAESSATGQAFDLVTGQVCQSCSLYRQCWETNFHRTYQVFTDLWTEIDEHGPLPPNPENLVEFCIYHDRVALALNYRHDLQRSRHTWERRLEEGRSVVGDYVKSVTRVLDRFVDEFDDTQGKGRQPNTPTLRVFSGVARLPKRGGHVSGDSYLSANLGADRYLMALSDGMGVGRGAAAESKQCVHLLHQMIEAGFATEVAVQTVNSVLLLRSPEDTFATVDVCLCDLASGRAEFVKIGAAPSFIKRGSDITLVKMSSVPVGIINQVQIEPEYRNLRPGDLLVMITDGVWDVSKDDIDKERWLINHLSKETSTDPEEVAESVLARATELMPEVGDDMTVLVARFDPVSGARTVAEAKRPASNKWVAVRRAPRPGSDKVGRPKQ